MAEVARADTLDVHSRSDDSSDHLGDRLTAIRQRLPLQRRHQRVP
jgi:hypothetical protein